jgi:O-antigen ligase
LAVGIFIAGLIYVPLCIFEILLGPKLHLSIYGFAQGDFTRSAMRFGGWRPMVFMNSGLAVALWMAAASVLGIWIWRAGVLPSFHGIKMAWLAAVLVLTTLGLKSVNGWLLLLLGTILLMTARRWRNAALVYVTILLAPIYVVVSATGVWSREELLPPVSSILNADRAQSLRYRFLNEQVIARNARERPILGWGRTGAAFEDRNHEIFPFGDRKLTAYAVIDSLWIAVFASFGAIGLAGLLGTLLLPVTLAVWRFPAARWAETKIAPVAALALVLLLYTFDDLANSFINPVFMLVAGGLAHCGSEQGA